MPIDVHTFPIQILLSRVNSFVQIVRDFDNESLELRYLLCMVMLIYVPHLTRVAEVPSSDRADPFDFTSFLFLPYHLRHTESFFDLLRGLS